MRYLYIGLAFTIVASCKGTGDRSASGDSTDYISRNLAGYASVKLTADLSKLNDSDKKVIPLLIEASKIMDTLFWWQTYSNPDSLLSSVKDEKTKQLVMINYGPWDRLNGDTPFIAGIGTKPLTSNFYPANMTKEELDKSSVQDKEGQYSIIRRDSTGKLYS